MGYKVKAQKLDLPDCVDEDNPEDSLVVWAMLPTIGEGATINAGRIKVPDEDAEGGLREETSEELLRRVFRFMAPKLRSWNLEDDEGRPIPLPRDLYSGNTPEAITKQVEHLYAQDENTILAIWTAWRSAGLPKKADSDEGKASETPSTSGLDASRPSEISQSWDVRELERSIPMG